MVRDLDPEYPQGGDTDQGHGAAGRGDGHAAARGDTERHRPVGAQQVERRVLTIREPVRVRVVERELRAGVFLHLQPGIHPHGVQRVVFQ